MMDNITHALQGIKVLDLSRVLGGPYATQILADHGAEVIKVEPADGDEVRYWGPPFNDGIAAYFINLNRNKKSISIDLRQKQGQDIILKLLAESDILVENFKTGTMENWGLGFDDVLSKKFPKLIHCRISGFGSDGPLGGYPGYDVIIQAMSGMMSINGMPDNGSVRIGSPIVDMGTGLYSTIGILMALQERHLSGLGQFIDMTLYDSAIALMHPHNANFLLSGVPGSATGNDHPNISPYGKYETATNEIVIMIGNNNGFSKLCNELGLQELSANPKFRNNADRVKNRAELNELIHQALKEVDGSEFSEKLLAAGVPAGPVRNIKEALNHQHTNHRNMKMSHNNYEGISSPIKFSRSKPSGVHTIPSFIGQHTREILESIGYDQISIEDMISIGVVSEVKEEDNNT
jgi:crotonobetainyl-CoA:carnitine CoA-transferase CaiB-like acyl-CoA transferase